MLEQTLFSDELGEAQQIKLQSYLTFSEQQNILAIRHAGLSFLASCLHISIKEAMLLSLGKGIWPLRFLRNAGVLKASWQSTLLQKKVCIIGCGGLGGYVALFLARLGIGGLTLCDDDVFEESNLNRQVHCRESNLGQNKAQALADEVSSIASHVDIILHKVRATESNLADILGQSHLAIDCLDNIPTRKILAETAQTLGLPFVHGSLAGNEGFAMLALPEQNSFKKLYTGSDVTGVEKKLGTPTLTPPYVALLQTNLAVQCLLGLNNRSAHKLWHIDIWEFGLESFNL